MKDYILFDLDGTLTNPKEGITKSVQFALRRYGIRVDDLDSLIPFIGAAALRELPAVLRLRGAAVQGGGAGVPGVFHGPGMA